jgi:hypothetical protein
VQKSPENMSRKFAEQGARERAGETWDSALLYAFKTGVRDLASALFRVSPISLTTLLFLLGAPL